MVIGRSGINAKSQIIKYKQISNNKFKNSNINESENIIRLDFII